MGLTPKEWVLPVGDKSVLSSRKAAISTYRTKNKDKIPDKKVKVIDRQPFLDHYLYCRSAILIPQGVWFSPFRSS